MKSFCSMDDDDEGDLGEEIRKSVEEWGQMLVSEHVKETVICEGVSSICRRTSLVGVLRSNCE